MMDNPVLEGVILPHFSFLSQNQNSLSVYTTSATGRARRENIRSNLAYYARQFNILCLQETQLQSSDSTSLKGLPFLRRHTVLYGNGDGRAGVVTILPALVTSCYDFSEPEVPAEIQGHVHITNLTPLAANRLPFQIFNLYLPSNGELRLLVLQFIRSQLLVGQHHYVCGDFNFVESTDDGSMLAAQALSAPERAIWEEFCVLGGLMEVSQPTHTYYRFDRNSGKIHSSRLDRFYVSHRPADLTVAAPACQIASAPFSLLKLHRIRASAANEPEGPHSRAGFEAAPDHYPVSLHFVSTLPSKKRSPNIPTWLVGSAMFKSEFESAWALAAHEGFEGARAFKLIAHRVAVMVLRYRHHSSSSSQIRVLSAAVALLRQLTQPVPLRGRVDDLIDNHRELAPCINTVTGLPTYALTSKFISDYLVSGPDVGPLQKADLDLRAGSHATNMIKNIKVQLPIDRKRLTHFVDYSDTECRDQDRPRFAEGPVSNPVDMGALISFHWGKIWAKRLGSPPRERILHYLSGYTSRVLPELCPTMPCRNGDNVHSATEDTWEKLVLRSIRHSNNSCAGPDGVPFTVYRTLVEHAAPFLLDILIAMAGGVMPPLDFNVGRLFLIPKGDSHKVLDNRPITVNNADNRLIASVVTTSISHATCALVHTSQKGFVSERRGSDNIVAITDLFYSRLEEGSELHILQVDTRKAFDSIDHPFIMAVLAHVGFPPWLILVVLALFQSAAVVPVLAAQTSDKIPIKRGVKQGCPLNPTLFVIIYDPLICEIAALDDGASSESPFAFADDLAIAVTSILLAISAMLLITAFADISGLGVNDDKSRLLSTIPLDVDQLSSIAHSPWPELLRVDSLTYLGIVFGHEVTVVDVFAKPLAKLADRVSLYGHVIRRFSLHLRVVAINVFLVSLFSYHIGFYYPLAVIDNIYLILRPLAVPFKGTAFKLGHLFLGPSMGAYGLDSPLKDIWAWSIAMLANKFDLKSLHGSPMEEVDVLGDLVPNQLTSMRIEDHIRACAHEVLLFTVSADGTCDTSKFIPNSAEGRRCIYKRVAVRAWRSSLDLIDGVRVGSLVRRMVRWGCGTTLAAEALTRRWCSGDLFATPYAKAHHFYMLFNALSTNRRVSSFGDDFSDRLVSHCYFCGLTGLEHQSDSIEHIYAECVVIRRARERFLGCFDLVFPFDLPHSLLAHVESDPQVKHRRRILFSAIILFNSTVWSVRWRVFVPALHYPHQDTAVNMVCSQAITDWNGFTRRTPALYPFKILLDVGKMAPFVPVKRLRKRKSCDDALKFIMSPPPGALLLFTDGGAKPNPGPCGAGVVTLRDSRWGRSQSAHLGHGSNNLGEVFAFGMALDFGLEEAAREIPGRLVTYCLLSDSTFAIGAITKGDAIKSSRSEHLFQLVQIARSKFRSLRRLVDVQTFWVRGHCSIEGNERADRLASEGVALSTRAPLDRSVVERALASKCFIFQPP